MLIKRWIPEHDQNILFEHTRKLRERKQLLQSHTAASTPVAGDEELHDTPKHGKGKGTKRKPSKRVTRGVDFADDSSAADDEFTD